MDDPAGALRELLARDRERGLRFEHAWSWRVRDVLAGVDGVVDRAEWATAFTDLEYVWRDAYDRTPRPSAVALSADLVAEAA